MKLDVTFKQPEISFLQYLHVTLKFPSSLSGISKCFETSGSFLLAIIEFEEEISKFILETTPDCLF